MAAYELGIKRTTGQTWANAAGIGRKRQFYRRRRNSFRVFWTDGQHCGEYQ